MKPPEAIAETHPRSLNENDDRFHFQCTSPEAEPVAADDSLRCQCGALLARWVAAGLELKCRRCKRTMLVPYPKRAGLTRSRAAR